MNAPASLLHKVAIIGSPSRTEVPWTRETLSRLSALGFNAVQLNIAWGSRPADEPLNLEDLFSSTLDASGSLADDGHGPDPRPEAFARRRSDLAARIDLCRDSGLRSTSSGPATAVAECRSIIVSCRS